MMCQSARIRKWAGPHEIFSMKIKIFCEFEHFTKILCHENLELYGTSFVPLECTLPHFIYLFIIILNTPTRGAEGEWGIQDTHTHKQINSEEIDIKLLLTLF